MFPGLSKSRQIKTYQDTIISDWAGSGKFQMFWFVQVCPGLSRWYKLYSVVRTSFSLILYNGRQWKTAPKLTLPEPQTWCGQAWYRYETTDNITATSTLSSHPGSSLAGRLFPTARVRDTITSVKFISCIPTFWIRLLGLFLVQNLRIPTQKLWTLFTKKGRFLRTHLGG